jgi:hypothetical protein
MLLAVFLLVFGILLISLGVYILLNHDEALGLVPLVIGGVLISISIHFRSIAQAENRLVAVSEEGSVADCDWAQSDNQADKYRCSLTEPVQQRVLTEFRTRKLTIWILGDKMQIQEGWTE